MRDDLRQEKAVAARLRDFNENLAFCFIGMRRHPENAERRPELFFRRRAQHRLDHRVGCVFEQKLARAAQGERVSRVLKRILLRETRLKIDADADRAEQQRRQHRKSDGRIAASVSPEAPLVLSPKT